jgi:pyruvate,water dikinase
MSWIFADTVTQDATLFTRAITGDLFPGPVSPLTATAGIAAHLETAWAATYAEAGLRRPHQRNGSAGAPVTATFGACLFLNTSLLRQFGEHAVGADPGAFSRQFVGERNDVPRHGSRLELPDTSPIDLGRWTRSLLEMPARITEGALTRACAVRLGRPPLEGATVAELLARIGSVHDELSRVAEPHVRTELAVAASVDLLTRHTEQAGQPNLTGELVRGWGPADSDPIITLWKLSRLIRRSRRLDALFDRHAAGVAEQLDHPNSDVQRLRAGVERIGFAHGHVGPTEWELCGETWETRPRILFRTLDLLRKVDDSRDPHHRIHLRADRTAELNAAVHRALRGTPRALAEYERVLVTAHESLGVRRRVREAVSVLNHELRLAALEIGRRLTDAGHLDDTEQIFMLRLPEHRHVLDDPEQIAQDLRMRSYDYHALKRYRAPFATTGPAGPPFGWPPGEVPRRGRRGRSGIVNGNTTSVGCATGQAGVLSSSSDLAGLEPGDVLVIPHGGFSWVPLLPAVSAVVADTACALSDVADACRDLSIPCISATGAATRRIQPRQMVQVDSLVGAARLTDDHAPEEKPEEHECRVS